MAIILRGEALVEMRVAAEEICLPKVEMLEAVETWVISLFRQMVIPTPPFPIRHNFKEDLSLTEMRRGTKGMIGCIVSVLRICRNNARVRDHHINQRNLRN